MLPEENMIKSHDKRSWIKWLRSGAVSTQGPSLTKLGDDVSFPPDTVKYVARPGEIATSRPLEEVYRVLSSKGLTPINLPGGLLAAVTEKYPSGNPSIIDYWDSQGRVCRTDVIGRRGGIKSDGLTNIYQFDQEGRLTVADQLIHKQGRTQLFRGTHYEYPEGTPSAHYTSLETNLDGTVERITFKDRKHPRIA